MNHLLDAVKYLLQSFLSLFRFHKLKILFFILALIVFTILLFPYDDLKDYITTNIYKASNKQVYLTFEKVGFAFLPTFRLKMNNISIDTPALPKELKAQELTLAPSIFSLLTMSYGGTATASELFGGEWDIYYKQGKKIAAPDGAKETVDRFWQHIEIETQDVQIHKVTKLFPKSPVHPKGKLSGLIKAKADTLFKEQPDGDFELQTGPLILPPSVANTAMGEINLPEFKFSKSKITGRLTNSELIIESMELGANKDPVFAKLKGKMNISFASGFRQNMGPYDFKLDLVVKKAEQKRLSLFLILLDNFKKPSGNAVRYLVKISGSRMGSTPNIGALSSF